MDFAPLWLVEKRLKREAVERVAGLAEIAFLEGKQQDDATGLSEQEAARLAELKGKYQAGQ